MSGIKGRSGRRPIGVELKRFATIDKAWRMVDKALDNNDIKLVGSDISRIGIAERLVRADISKEKEQKNLQVGSITYIINQEILSPSEREMLNARSIDSGQPAQDIVQEL